MTAGNEQQIRRVTLPFAITPEQVPATEIEFRVGSTKIMSGFDEIVIRGTGDVILRTAARENDPPRELEGRVEPTLVARLLLLLGAEGVEGWDDIYRAETREFVSKALTITVDGAQQKEVAMHRTEFPEFSRAVGAIKLLAAVARPEALGGAFFQRI